MDDEGLVTSACWFDITVFGVVRLGGVFGVVRLGGVFGVVRLGGVFGVVRLGRVFGVVRLGSIEENVSGMVKFGCPAIKPFVENTARHMRKII
jgi:hypothetical protein